MNKSSDFSSFQHHSEPMAQNDGRSVILYVYDLSQGEYGVLLFYRVTIANFSEIRSCTSGTSFPQIYILAESPSTTLVITPLYCENVVFILFYFREAYIFVFT